MARAMSSLPVPLSPWISTVLSLWAMRGMSLKISHIWWLAEVMCWKLARPSTALRSSSTRVRSRKDSTPPTTLPSWLRSRAVLTLMDTFLRKEVWMFTCLFTSGEPVAMVSLRAQEPSQMSALKTFQHCWPRASSGVMPMISAAARLKDVMRKSSSTVKTPSLMESRIVRRSRERVLEATPGVAFRTKYFMEDSRIAVCSAWVGHLSSAPQT